MRLDHSQGQRNVGAYSWCVHYLMLLVCIVLIIKSMLLSFCVLADQGVMTLAWGYRERERSGSKQSFKAH